MIRGDKLWVHEGDGIWREATYEFRITAGEPLGRHSVMLADGGGRRVVCSCRTSVVEPNTNSPGPAGSAALNGDSTAGATPGDSPSAPLVGNPGGSGERDSPERAKLRADIERAQRHGTTIRGLPWEHPDQVRLRARYVELDAEWKALDASEARAAKLEGQR